MTGIHVQIERDCRSMTYRLSDAQNIDLIIGYLGDISVFVAARGHGERADRFYERAVDLMWEMRFAYEAMREAEGDTELDEHGFERRPGLVPSLMLIDTQADFKRYSALIPDHVVDDPEWIAASGYSDYLMSRVERWAKK